MNMNTTTSVPSQDAVASVEPELEFFEEYTAEYFGFKTEEEAKTELNAHLDVAGYDFDHFFHEVQFDELSGKWGYVIYGSSE